MNFIKKSLGFSLIEMLVVLAIIGILSAIMLPSPEAAITRKQILESLELIEDFKKQVVADYTITKNFPVDNAALEIPKPELLIGNYVKKIEVTQGAFNIYFGGKASLTIKDKILTVRPIVVKDSPESPISWICGYSKAPDGMIAVGENKTSIEVRELPMACRM